MNQPAFLPVDTAQNRRYAPLRTAALPRPTMLKRILAKLTELLNRTADVRYYSTPVWKPWRDF